MYRYFVWAVSSLVMSLVEGQGWMVLVVVLVVMGRGKPE